MDIPLIIQKMLQQCFISWVVKLNTHGLVPKTIRKTITKKNKFHSSRGKRKME